MQQIALAGLYRSQFFDKAAFYGGTCLRIFHDLQRFSEDMDFTLLKKDEDFSIEKHFDSIENEFRALGRKVEIQKKEKKGKSQIESAFLKDNTDIYNIQFQTEPSIRIKLEVDKDPPLLFKSEHKLLLLPFSFMTRCVTLSGLFAGKMHAFLFRTWRNRVKGRDWYDFEWYIRNQIPINFSHFLERSIQSESIERGTLTRDGFRELLKKKINEIPIGQVIADASPFIKNIEDLEIWSTEYFLQLVDLLQFE
jgi:predicted nucleotidyltransferase component of viral defense system